MEGLFRELQEVKAEQGALESMVLMLTAKVTSLLGITAMQPMANLTSHMSFTSRLRRRP